MLRKHVALALVDFTSWKLLQVQLVSWDSYTAHEPKLLEQCLRQPSSKMAAPFDQAHGGKSFFEWAREYPGFEENYSQAMTEADCLGAMPMSNCLARWPYATSCPS